MFDLAAPAPAKINLTLEIIGRRPDGYHNLRSIMQTLELADDVRIVLDSEHPGITVSGPYAEGVPADETNLAWKAAEILAQRTSHPVSGLQIHLDKRIPAAGGLGGGASDAATTLRLLQQAWDASDEVVEEAALAIGSDEVFFLRGATALVEGRGERVTALPALPGHAVVLFVPRTSLERKTASLFAAVSKTPFDDGSQTDRLLLQIPTMRSPVKLMTADLVNGFERVAFDLFPGLADLAGRIEFAIESAVRLCGAGPTLLWLGSRSEAAEVIAKTRNVDCRVIETATSEGPWAR